MSETQRTTANINEGWLLSNLPFVSFVCDNDALYSMRLIVPGSAGVFGYSPEDFVNNKSYFAASTIHPDDQDIVDAHAEQAAAGGSPVVSRYRLVHADGDLVPVMLVSKAVLSAAGELQGFAGNVIDLRGIPELQGTRGLLSQMRVPVKRRPPAGRPQQIDAVWAASQLPLVTFFARNDENYTICKSCGSAEELIGYSAADFEDPKKYKASSATYPPDLDVADAYIEAAASREGAQAVARLRLVDADGELVPVLIFARGARPAGGETGVVGGVLDIRNVPSLLGPSKLLQG